MPREPALPFFDERKRMWAIKMGYKHDKDGKRVRAWHYFSGPKSEQPPANVITDATNKRREWEHTVENWSRLGNMLAFLDPEHDYALPVWIREEVYKGRQQEPTPAPSVTQIEAKAAGGTLPQKVQCPAAATGPACNWTREEIANWLMAQARGTGTFIAGIDHNFSFPVSYMERYGLRTWDEFLADFHKHWPTDRPHTYVEFLWEDNARIGSPNEFRLTERWTSSAKGVFA